MRQTSDGDVNIARVCELTFLSNNVQLDDALASMLVVQDSCSQRAVVANDTQLVDVRHDPNDR